MKTLLAKIKALLDRKEQKSFYYLQEEIQFEEAREMSKLRYIYDRAA
jgi:hypothetical protein